ncbi:hypothetical protein BDV23DRAFT_184858 [Aspergillus alliaceus]|uniref:Uncharacterized protein n=1 Tax=Petromyces alliaceus TaxID=209559 RepID=A0A5N7C4P8_PETAA|nr:hypothetical protein BDV23DRAFT_184858 [Aspergillus alliaceus]
MPSPDHFLGLHSSDNNANNAGTWDNAKYSSTGPARSKAFCTASVARKIARLGRSEEAISMINGALDIWFVDPTAHKDEIARSPFRKGNIFGTVGEM